MLVDVKYDDNNVEDDDVDHIDDTGTVDSDCVEISNKLPSALHTSQILDELQTNSSASLSYDVVQDTTDLHSTLISSLKCAICSNTSFSGQLINDQYVCETCCKVKIETNDDDQQWHFEEESSVTGDDLVDDVAASHDLPNKLETIEVSGDEDADLTAVKTLPDERYQCALCNKVYCKKKSMINHVKNHDKKPKTFTCKVCNSNFRSLVLLKKHKKRHVRKSTNNTLIYCEICKKYFKTKKGFAYHQQKICIQYKCYICDEKFLVHSVLMDHMRNKHEDAKKTPSALLPSIIEGVESDSATIATTLLNDNETVMSVCPICLKVVTQAVLPRHMILHSKDKPFTCDMCGKSFKRKHSLQDHIMIEMGMKNYVCDICGMKFLKQGYLNKHVRYHQLNNGEFQGFRCEMCGKKFPEKWRLGVHQRSVHKGGRFSSCKCDICGSMFAERWMVRRHKAQEHNGEEFKEYQCDVCGKKFQEKWMIRSHQRSTHKSGVKKVYCEICGRDDHTQNDCTHRHAIQEVDCALCGELFPSGLSLKEHVTSVHHFNQLTQLIKEEDPVLMIDGVQEVQNNILHICAGCGKEFASKQMLRQHEIVANCIQGVKYECEECSKVFHSKSSLSNHVMSHQKANISTMFKCDFCNREFRSAEALESHMSGDKLCLICGKVYPCDDQLRNHVYKEHDDDDDDDENRLPPYKRARPSSSSHQQQNDESSQDEGDSKPASGTSSEKPFECRLCHKRFARKQAMKNHLYAELNLRRHECEFCDKRYNYYSHLKEHIITNHGEKEYACVQCGKEFPTRKRFRDHVTLHSNDKPFVCECGLSFKLNRYMSKHKKKCKAIRNQLLFG